MPGGNTIPRPRANVHGTHTTTGRERSRAQGCPEVSLSSTHTPGQRLGAMTGLGPTPCPGPAALAAFSWPPGSLLLWGHPGSRCDSCGGVGGGRTVGFKTHLGILGRP